MSFINAARKTSKGGGKHPPMWIRVNRQQRSPTGAFWLGDIFKTILLGGGRGYSRGAFLKVGAYSRTYGRFCITKLFACSLWETLCRLAHNNFSFRVAIVITDSLMFP